MSELGQKPVVLNCMNIKKAANGEPTLLSYDEVSTLFHEFGHAVHGLFSKVKYPQLSGTNTPRDFVEFPSQFEEDWSLDKKVLANYAKHYQTGEAMPQELVDKIRKAATFNKGFDGLEALEAQMLDQDWHNMTVAQAAAVTDPGGGDTGAIGELHLDRQRRAGNRPRWWIMADDGRVAVGPSIGDPRGRSGRMEGAADRARVRLGDTGWGGALR